MNQRKANRNRVISARRFTDGRLHDSKRLIGEAAQPQGAGEEDERADALINAEEVDVEGTKLDCERHAALTMELCRGLVAQKVMGNAQPTLRPDGAGRLLGSLRDDAGLFRNRQGAADVAKPYEKEVQTEEKAQLAPTVLESFRQRKSTFEFGTDLIAETLGKHRRQRQNLLKNHLLSGASAGIVESGLCPFAPTPAFLQQRQSDEQGRRPGGKFDADRSIAMVGQRPSERHPRVADMRRVSRKIMFAKQRLDDLVVFEKLGIKDRMAPGDAICLVSLGEFGSGVGARGVEQPIVGRFVDDGRGYQGLCNQARDRVDNACLVYLCLRRNGAGGLTREVPKKERQPAQDHLLALRKQAVTPIEHRVQRLVPR